MNRVRKQKQCVHQGYVWWQCIYFLFYFLRSAFSKHFSWSKALHNNVNNICFSEQELKTSLQHKILCPQVASNLLLRLCTLGKALTHPARGKVSEKCTRAPWGTQESMHKSHPWAWHKPSASCPGQLGPLFHLSQYQCPLYPLTDQFWCCRSSLLVQKGSVPHGLHLHPTIRGKKEKHFRL